MSDVSPFLSLWRQGRDEMDSAFAEWFTIKPQIVYGDKRPVTDATRPETQFRAGWQSASTNDFGMSPGHSNNMGQKVVSSLPLIIMSIESLPFRPSPPDRLVRESTGERYEVSTVQPDGYGRLVVSLTLRSAA